jgi:hypothetical protein
VWRYRRHAAKWGRRSTGGFISIYLLPETVTAEEARRVALITVPSTDGGTRCRSGAADQQSRGRKECCNGGCPARFIGGRADPGLRHLGFGKSLVDPLLGIGWR